MKKSLKSELQRIIRERGYLSTDQVEAYCKEHNYRLSNAERRLRESESPMIEAVREKGYIIGYKPKMFKEFIFSEMPDLAPKQEIKFTPFPSAFPKKEEKTQGLF